MRPKQLAETLLFCITNKFPVLITGAPGIGKSDIVEQAVAAAATAMNTTVDLIISHPVVSDPTDYKGMPFAQDGEAHFLPFGDLNKLIKAAVPTVFFLDDFGQAPPAVQAACMQLLLARRINGHRVSDHVIFIAATNRKEDKAGVSGLLEPVKSRFATIINLDVNVDDWCEWALTHGMPSSLVSFIRFRPALLSDGKPSKDIVNTTSPRTVAFVGKLQNAGIDDTLRYEVFKGAAGEGFAAEYLSFLSFCNSLPDIEKIFTEPDAVDVPNEPGVLYAMSGVLAGKMDETNAENAFKYLDRLPAEITIATVKDAVTRNKKISATKAFIAWAANNSSLIFN
jgi:hypothetical protein